MATNALLDMVTNCCCPPRLPLSAATSLSGGTPVHYLCEEANGWMPDLADIRGKITSRPRASW